MYEKMNMIRYNVRDESRDKLKNIYLLSFLLMHYIGDKKMKDIKGFEGLYAVTSDGRIWSYKKQDFRNTSLSKGYEVITLHKDKWMKTYSVHRIVASNYLDNLENKTNVNHINGIKTDNRVENLEWVTPSENTKHAFESGLRTRKDLFKSGIFHPNYGKSPKNALKVICNETGKEFRSISKASEQMNICYSSIIKNLYDKNSKYYRKNAKGYTFKYVERVF